MSQTAASERLRTSLRGPVEAMATPFKDDLSLDLDGLKRLTDLYIEGGITNVIVAGSTGEFFSMTDEERREVIASVVEQSAGRMTVIAGCAHSGTQLTVALAQHAKDVGADGAMVTPPYYSHSGFAGIKRHFEIVSESVDIGIVVYFSGSVLRFPAVSGVVREDFVCPPEMIELADIPNVGAFKDASGNYGFHRDVCVALDGPEGRIAVMGSDGMSYHLWGHTFGSRCYLTGLGNIWPRVEADFFSKLGSGDTDGAREIVVQKELPYLAATKATGKYWACVKTLLDMIGEPGGPMRPPLLDLNDEEKAAMRRMAKAAGLL